VQESGVGKRERASKEGERMRENKRKPEFLQNKIDNIGLFNQTNSKSTTEPQDQHTQDTSIQIFFIFEGLG
jgi:hypothetical protein